MDEVSVSISAGTDVGMQRSGNEDAFLIADLTTGNIGLGPEVTSHEVGDRGSLMVVSDGMGGAVAGEIASDLAVTTIRETLIGLSDELEISEKLRTATETANARIWEEARLKPELSGMGATSTAVLVKGTKAYVAQVGDSRAYLVRQEQVKQLTKDQSLAQMLVDSGALAPDQMDSVPQNVIMQALGTQPTVKVAMSEVDLSRDDFLVICSDGLSNKIRTEEIRQVVRESADMSSACRRFIELANERGGEDNITVIVARFDGDALNSGSERVSITGSLRAVDQQAEPLNERSLNQYSTAARDLDERPATTQVLPAVAALAGDEPEAASELEYPAIPASESALNDVERRRQAYTPILIIGLISLLLLALALFIAYWYYVRTPPAGQEPASVGRNVPASRSLWWSASG